MAFKTCSILALFLTLNLLFFSLVSASDCGSDPKPTPSSNPNPNTSGGSVGSGGSAGSSGSGGQGGWGDSCSRDALKLGVCANVLNGLLNVTLGQPPVTPCCSLLNGLVDLEAALCLCTALKANILGTNLNLSIALSLLLSACSRQVPRDLQCS